MLPYLLSYEDPKIEKAYRRYLDGDSQRKIAKALKIPGRTLARRCNEGGWTEERKLRRASAQEPEVAAAATPGEAPVAKVAAETSAPLPTPPPKPGNAPKIEQPSDDENPRHAMDRMLRKQQRFVDRLMDAADRASEELMQNLEGKPARAALAQVSQLTSLGGRLLEMQRKAYRVPDKLELEDTTPAQKHIDNVRRLRMDREAAAVAHAAAGQQEPVEQSKPN